MNIPYWYQIGQLYCPGYCPSLGRIAIDPPRGRPSEGPGGHPSERPLREGLAHGAGPGPAPAHEAMNSYSAQEGTNSQGNIIGI